MRQRRTSIRLLVGGGVVEVALGDVGAADAHLPDLARRLRLVGVVQDGHLEMT